MSVKQLVLEKHRHLLKNGGNFTFSMTYSLDALDEIKGLGEWFSSSYNHTVADIPGMPGCRLICISLKDQNRR